MSNPVLPPTPSPPIGQRGVEMLCVMSIMTAFAVLLVSLRMYVRLRSERGTGWDDWTIVVATVRLETHCLSLEELVSNTP